MKTLNASNLETIVIGYPFVNHVDQNAKPTIENAENYVKEIYTNQFHSHINNLMSLGAIKSMGYYYDCRSFLKKFVYKQYGQWSEAYAPNKTLLRKAVYGRIDKIVEI